MVHPQELERSWSPSPPGLAHALSAPVDAPRAGSSLATVLNVIQYLTDDARSMIGAHHAVIRVAVDDNWSRVISAASFSDKYSAGKKCDTPAGGLGLDSLLGPVLRPVRLTHEQLAVHPSWNVFGKLAKNRPSLQGWLAVPLFDRLGRNFGLIELTNKENGDFSAEDELRLTHFAKVASLAVENAWLYQAAHERADTPSPSLPRLLLPMEIARVLANDTDLRGALKACAETVVRQTDVALVRIWVLETGVMSLLASAGSVVPVDDGRARVPVGQFSIGHIARTRKSLVTNSILDHPHVHDKEWSRREGMTSFAGCPLLVENELLGVIVVFDRKPITGPTFESLTASARDIALAVKRYYPESGSAPLDPALRAEHAVIVSTRDGAVADWNHGAETFFGYRRAEAVGQPLQIIVPADRLSEHDDIMRRVAQGEQIARSETIRQHKTGRSLDVCLTVSALHDAVGAVVGAITVAHDLSDVRRLQQQHRIAQKMEVFGQLAGGVAHDFNNLLTVIMGYSEIVINRLTPDHAMRELLGEIHKAGERAETLTRQILAFTRKKVLEPKILDLNAVVSDTEKMLRRLIGEDILMTTIFAPFLRLVKLDPGQMQQVILNLAVNARDAMPNGGRLTIETGNVTLDEAYAFAHPDVQPGDYVLFAMSDTGVGMNAATKARIFEPLFTTKGPGKGTGLGLTTVHSIIKQHGGHIEVYSELGRGTTFKVYFPQADETVPSGKSHHGQITIQRGNETILLVEDEDSVRKLARHVLELNGYHVLEAADGDEALRLASTHAGDIHLLLTDVVMPNLGGRPLADRLLASYPQLKVLFLSGYTNEAIVRHGVIDSDFAFLQKPFTTITLAQKVRDVLDQAGR